MFQTASGLAPPGGLVRARPPDAEVVVRPSEGVVRTVLPGKSVVAALTHIRVVLRKDPA